MAKSVRMLFAYSYCYALCSGSFLRLARSIVVKVSKLLYVYLSVETAVIGNAAESLSPEEKEKQQQEWRDELAKVSRQRV